MDESIEFKNLKELYERVTPALYSKVKELRNHGFKYVTEIDIWNYLIQKSWKDRVNLELHELISDIIHCDNIELNEYAMNKLNEYKNKEEVIIDKKENL